MEEPKVNGETERNENKDRWRQCKTGVIWMTEYLTRKRLCSWCYLCLKSYLFSGPKIHQRNAIIRLEQFQLTIL